MIKLFTYFEKALQNFASDLHLKAGSPPVLRIGGRLVKLPEDPLTAHDMPKLLLPILDINNQKKLKVNYEVNFIYEYKNKVRVRVCIFKQRGSLSASFRFIPSSLPTIDQLKLPLKLREIINKPRGLFLVTGPANSGKTHTLAALVHEINKSSCKHIITIEDPIEFIHKPIKSVFTQREIGTMTNNYHTALMNALREDPDVILVGEMRDLKTMEMVLTAAETGHFVLSTLHTVGAVETIDRIINVFPAYRQDEIRMQLSMVLIGIISQLLLPTKSLNERVLVYELMILNSAMRNLIREKKTNQLKSALVLARKEGCITLKDQLNEALKDDRLDSSIISELIKEIIE